IPAHSVIPSWEVTANLINDDEIANVWYCTGCLLATLTDREAQITDIREQFIAFYSEELESIASKHAELAKQVGQHVAAIIADPSLLRPGVVDDKDAVLFKKLRTLRERLYTFIACGVRSSVKTEADSGKILKKLGFEIRQRPEINSNLLK